MSASDVLMNMSWPTERELEQHTESQNKSSVFVGVAMISFFIYIIILILLCCQKENKDCRCDYTYFRNNNYGSNKPLGG